MVNKIKENFSVYFFGASYFVLAPMRALALDAAINDGSTTTTTFGILRGFLTRGAAFFLTHHFPCDFVQIENKTIERKICIKG